MVLKSEAVLDTELFLNKAVLKLGPPNVARQTRRILVFLFIYLFFALHLFFHFDETLVFVRLHALIVFFYFYLNSTYNVLTIAPRQSFDESDLDGREAPNC